VEEELDRKQVPGAFWLARHTSCGPVRAGLKLGTGFVSVAELLPYD
jgi:hypothetical protein